MTVKEKIIQAVEMLPADNTVEEAMERLLFLRKLREEFSRRMQEKLSRTRK